MSPFCAADYFSVSYFGGRGYGARCCHGEFCVTEALSLAVYHFVRRET